MGASSADHSSSALEQSLRRSFSAIHRPPLNTSLPHLSSVSNHDIDDSNGSGSHIETRQYNILKRDRCGKAIRSKRGSLTTAIPSHTSRAVAPPLLSKNFPTLPFSKGGSPQPQRESSRERPAKKFQRRYSAITAVMGQEIVTKLMNEKQHERRHSMKVKVRMTDNNDNPRRRASVTVAPPTPSSSSMENDGRQTAEEQHRGFRKDYSIGETIRSPSHMIIEPTSEQAIQAVSSLNRHDVAFVKRSDGSYSYAILAYRSMEPIKGAKNKSMEECMIFVMSDVGCTKMVRKRHWSQFVRLVFMGGLDSHPVTTTTTTCATHNCPPSLDQHLKEHSVFLCQEITPPVLCQGIEHGSDVDWIPPSMISFVPQMDEECSLISSVSDRARAYKAPNKVIVMVCKGMVKV